MSGLSRSIIGLLLILLLITQARLWFGNGSISELQALSDRLVQQEAENNRLKNRNLELKTEVETLKRVPQALEELVRSRLGYIMKDETFVRVVPKEVLIEREKAIEN